MKKHLFLLTALTVCSLPTVFAKNNLSIFADSLKKPVRVREKAAETFKSTTVGNAQSTETLKAHTFLFKVSAISGNVDTAAERGIHSLYGIDNIPHMFNDISDMRLSFDYGVTDKLMLGIGRSKRMENIDGTVKYKILQQTKDDHVPYSITFYGNVAMSAQSDATYYKGLTGVSQKLDQRISYVSQLIIGRKYDDLFSFALLPTYQHRNFVIAYVNDNNKAVNPNDIFSLGLATKLKLGTNFSFFADYFLTYSDYFISNPATAFYNPFSLGCEFVKDRNVFHVTFTNASGVIENDYLTNTTSDFYKGGYRLGFSFSRVLNP